MFRKPDGAGKGDAPRPTDWEKFSNNFDNIFGKKDDTRATTTGEEKTREGNQGEGTK
jgi:hypothetical protein